MMRIEKIQNAPDRAGRYRVEFSDGTILRLYRQSVEDFGLYTGMELPQEQFHALNVSSQKLSAKMRAVRIISASSVSRRDLQKRLEQKGETADDAAAAVTWLEELNLLDDRKTAEQIVHSCISKGYGLSRAKQALYEKQIPKELWDSVLADYPEQTDRILSYLEAKLGDDYNRNDIQKAVNALMRRGHSYSAVRSALQAFTEQECIYLEEE